MQVRGRFINQVDDLVSESYFLCEIANALVKWGGFCRSTLPAFHVCTPPPCGTPRPACRTRGRCIELPSQKINWIFSKWTQTARRRTYDPALRGQGRPRSTSYFIFHWVKSEMNRRWEQKRRHRPGDCAAFWSSRRVPGTPSSPSIIIPCNFLVFNQQFVSGPAARHGASHTGYRRSVFCRLRATTVDGGVNSQCSNAPTQWSGGKIQSCLYFKLSYMAQKAWKQESRKARTSIPNKNSTQLISEA